jgi:hypothetical protein
MPLGPGIRVDPEFFRQHLDLGSRADQTGSSSFMCLPSECSNIIRLPPRTVGSRSLGNSLSRKQHHSKQSKVREEAGKRLEDHLKRITQDRESHLPQGRSLVRDFAVHNYRHFTLEQEISIYVAANNKHWVSIVWLDTGTDLGQDKSGSWQAKALQ